MEKRTTVRRRTGELKAASDAESTVSTRSSNSSNSSTSWKQKQRRLKTERLGSRSNGVAGTRAAGQGQVEGETDADDRLTSLEVRLGAVLETTEVQMTMVVLIALDVGCTALEMHLHDQQQLALALQQLNTENGGASFDVGGSVLARIATRLVESFTGFTLFLFLIELAVLLAAFRRQFFAHAGYVLDMVVVGVSLAMELYAQSKAVRLLGILRVWRVLRLVRRLVDQERAAHDGTRILFEQEQLKLLHVRMQKDAAHESLKREYESRSGLEQLLRSYKDEIVTLKEALQIAAQAVAEAAMAENALVNPDEFAEDALAASYPAADHYEDDTNSTYPQAEPGARYREEDNTHHQEEDAVVHPAEIQERWTGDGNAYQVQYAAAVHPAALLELEGGHHGETAAPQVAVRSTEVQAELEHGRESERDEFEDAVDE